MQILVNVIVLIGSVIWWIVQKFFPFLIKKFGLGAVKYGIQKLSSALVILVAISFYASVIVFISETFTVFRNLLEIISDPSSAGFGTTSELSCFMYLLHASGIADGFNAAFHFGISVFLFLFLHKLYIVTRSTAKLVSDEIAKNLKLF